MNVSLAKQLHASVCKLRQGKSSLWPVEDAAADYLNHEVYCGGSELLQRVDHDNSCLFPS